jgi:acetyltransferase-like isoleucine patch superfamily enzyme
MSHPIPNDPRGKLFDKIRNRQMRLLQAWWSPIIRFTARLKGIEMGRKNRFYGRAYLRRSPHTRIKIGDHCSFRSSFTSNLVGINRPCLICTWFDEAVIEIGDHVGMSGTVIGAKQHIKIGNHVMCGGNVFITDFDWHPVDPAIRHRCDLAPSSPTIIEDNVWVGMNAVVMKGVTIGKNSVIGANSVVVRDIPPNVIAAGNPAKVIKSLTPEEIATRPVDLNLSQS